MKKSLLLFVLLLCVCLLFGCSRTVPDHTQPPSASVDTPTTTPKIPDETKKDVGNPNGSWSVGMLVVLENTEMLRGISSESFEVFTDPGDVIRATVLVQNGSKKSQRFELMVFADGVPVEFKVEGKQYKSYPVTLTPQNNIIEMQFEKDFGLNLGRLDFILSYAENPQADFHFSAHTLWIELDKETLSPESLCSTVEQRVGLQGRYSGDVFDAWIWNEGVSPDVTDQMGPKAISIQNGETILLEAIAAKPGLYRTVLVVDGTPVEFERNGTQYSYLDWESTGTNMLQLPIKLKALPSSGSIYVVTTPLNTDSMAQWITASSRIELTTNGEG